MKFDLRQMLPTYGTLSRLPYLVICLAVMIASTAHAFVLDPMSGRDLFIILLLNYVGMCAMAKRSRDAGWPTWMVYVFCGAVFLLIATYQVALHSSNPELISRIASLSRAGLNATVAGANDLLMLALLLVPSKGQPWWPERFRSAQPA